MTLLSELRNKDYGDGTMYSYLYQIKYDDSIDPHEIENEMPQHIERWKNKADYAIQSMDDWKNEIVVLRNFAKKRPAIIREYLKKFNNKTS